MTDVAARLDGVTVEYATPTGPVAALDDVSMEFRRATSTAVVGRSGSGKSTLISVLSLLRRPTAGSVVVDGVETVGLGSREVARIRARSVGIVFQSFHLEPSLSAAENVMVPWVFGGAGPRRRARRRAVELLGELGIGDLADRRPHSMSGGQRQRVAIARALFGEPPLFLADEPTGNLDEETANSVADLLLGLPAAFGTSVVLVTHDAVVARMARSSVELARGRVLHGAPA